MLGFRVWYTAENMLDYSNDWAMNRDGKLCLVRSPECDLCDVSDDQEFIPMQSTGLFDANGKEIFEGDVLEDPSVSDDYPKKIINVFDTATFLWVMGHEREGNIHSKTLNSYEIIGNVYEHPGLDKKYYAGI